MKYFHEAPNSLFSLVQKYTDGDYFLVHLFDQNEEYLRNAKEAVANGRETILDNSIFELGTAYNDEPYVKWINEIKPTWFIIPDVLESLEGTLDNFYKWSSDPAYTTIPGKRIGVLQGKSEKELYECYQQMVVGVDMIAISFDYSFFEKEEGGNKLEKWMKGRQRLIHSMNEYVDKTLPHHLLGTALPQEGLFYKDLYPWIYSIDTSNPVVAGMHDMLYPIAGLSEKFDLKIADSIEFKASANQELITVINIENFKRYWK